MTKSPLKVYWWSPLRHFPSLRSELKSSAQAWVRLRLLSGRWLRNFGDELTPLVLQHLTGRTIVWSPPAHADVIAIGSIIEHHNRYGGSKAVVFGSGLRNTIADDSSASLRAALGQVIGVRGRLSQRDLGVEPQFLGDPGVIAADLFGGTTRVRTMTAAPPVLVPHFRAWQNASARRTIGQLQDEGARLVSPASTPRDVVTAMLSSKLVLTSSLHGLICAHAVGVPAQYVDFDRSESHAEPMYKYQDYLSTIDSSWDLASLTTSTAELTSYPSAVFERAASQAQHALERTQQMRDEIRHAAARSF